MRMIQLISIGCSKVCGQKSVCSWEIISEAVPFLCFKVGCVRGGMDVSEWFPVHVELIQGCVMSPWLLMCMWMVWCER